MKWMGWKKELPLSLAMTGAALLVIYGGRFLWTLLFG